MSNREISLLFGLYAELLLLHKKRLDMDWTHIPYAMKKGVMISINPDAHSITEIENIQWGVSSARKGGLNKEMTWNALPLKKIELWLKRKNARLQPMIA